MAYHNIIKKKFRNEEARKNRRNKKNKFPKKVIDNAEGVEETSSPIATTNEPEKLPKPPTRLISGGNQYKKKTDDRQTMMDFIDMQNPDKILKKFGVDVYDKMEDSDTHLYAVYQTRKLAISLCPWELIPASDYPRDIMIRDFVNDVIENARGPFSETIRQMADAIGKGFSVLEIVWKLIESGQWKGRYGIDEFIPHKQKYWRLSEKNLTKYRVPIVYFIKDDMKYEGKIIPNSKVVLYTYNSTGSLYGNAAFKACYWQTWFKKSGWKSWMVHLDKYAMPVAVGRFPDGTPVGEQDALLEILETIQKETCIVIPDSMRVEFLQASTTAAVSFRQMIDACNSEISKCLLGGTQTVEEGERGSYALSRAHSDVRQARCEADIMSIREVIQQQIIKPICDFNFKVNHYPWFEMKYPFAAAHLSEKEAQKKLTGGRPSGFSESALSLDMENAILKTYSNIIDSHKNNKTRHHPVNMKYIKNALLEKFSEEEAFNIAGKVKSEIEKSIKSNKLRETIDIMHEMVCAECN